MKKNKSAPFEPPRTLTQRRVPTRYLGSPQSLKYPCLERPAEAGSVSDADERNERNAACA